MVMTETLRRSDSLLALLVLVALSAGLGTVEAQASNECDKHLMACLNEHLVRFDHHNPTADMADTCRILKDFSDCVFKIECLTHSSKDELVNNLTSSFQNFGVDCDQQPTASTPRDPTHSSVPQVSSVDSACAEARNNCTTEFIEESFINEAKSQGADMRSWFCPSLNMYLDCLMSVSCDEENYDQSVGSGRSEQSLHGSSCLCV